MRHAALLSELEAAIQDNAVRVVMLTSPRGAGLTSALQAFAEEIRGWGHHADVTDCERAGVQPGGVVDALLRSRLGLDPADTGQRLLDALEVGAPGLEVLAREFFRFAMGCPAADDQTARLDTKSRWEGAIAEVSHFIERRPGSWAWILDDAVASDAESLRLIEQLVQASVPTPGLVVLAVRDDERALLEPRTRSLRATNRFREVALPPLSLEAFQSAFPGIAGSRLPLAARLLQHLGREGAAAAPEALARRVMEQASTAEQRVLGVLSTGGGRLPLEALDAVLGASQAAHVRALEERLVVRRGATLRNGGHDEVWLRFPSATPQPEADEARRWLEGLGRWARQVVFTPASPLRSLALQQLIRSAEAAHDTQVASFAWELSARLGGGLFALRKAEASASGVRRLVLGRLIAEDELFRGEVQRSLATVTATTRLTTTPPPALPAGWGPLVLSGVKDELERWDVLTVDEAQLCLELTRAEALSQLGQAADTRRAFEQVEQRLKKSVPSPVVSALWLRSSRTWAWFAAEVLADGPLARRVCEQARHRVPDEAMKASVHSLAFLRAEQVAHSRGGDSRRASQLADELISLSKVRGDAREECVAWNARGLLHLRDGELPAARTAFERSLDLARNIGFRRREAVALHNLGLTLACGGEYGASLAAQERYVALSEQIGNLLARAYGPAAMAMVHVMQVDVAKAEVALTKARRAAEENGWPGLVAWTRHLAGQLKLLRHLEKKDTLLLSLARSDFLACLDIVEDRKGTWSEEFDPAETAALLAMTWLCAGNRAQAQGVLARAERFADGSAGSRWVVEALRALLAGRAPVESIAWFDAHGHLRAAELWRRLAEALGLTLPAGEGDVRAGL
ncbi:MAG: tetratricopeptide repeat protein [Myxococcota bacterium]